MKVKTKDAGNMEQVKEIYEKHGNQIYSIIRSNINNKSDIDDIFQDYFLSIMQRPIPQQHLNILAFINRAIKNDVRDAASRSQSYYQRNRKYAEMHSDRFKSKTPDDIVIHSEEIRRLFEFVENQLLQHEAEAIINKFRHGKNNLETADVMDIERRSVSCYLCTGLKKLRAVSIFQELKRLIHDVMAKDEFSEELNNS